MDMLQAYKNDLLNNVHCWSKANINGRKVRNIILTAEDIAASDEKDPMLTPKHIDDQLNAIIEFQIFNGENSSRSKKIQFTESSRTSY